MHLFLLWINTNNKRLCRNCLPNINLKSVSLRHHVWTVITPVWRFWNKHNEVTCRIAEVPKCASVIKSHLHINSWPITSPKVNFKGISAVSPFDTFPWQYGRIVIERRKWIACFRSWFENYNHWSNSISTQRVVHCHDVNGASNGFLFAVETKLIKPHVLLELCETVCINKAIFSLFWNPPVVPDWLVAWWKSRALEYSSLD